MDGFIRKIKRVHWYPLMTWPHWDRAGQSTSWAECNRSVRWSRWSCGCWVRPQPWVSSRWRWCRWNFGLEFVLRDATSHHRWHEHHEDSLDGMNIMKIPLQGLFWIINSRSFRQMMHHFSGHQSRRACALWGPEARTARTRHWATAWLYCLGYHCYCSGNLRTIMNYWPLKLDCFVLKHAKLILKNDRNCLLFGTPLVINIL